MRIKFANVLLERNSRSLDYPGLYCSATGSVVFNRDFEEWELYGPGDFDFTTYFNALSVAKIKEYTVAKSFHLHLEIKGASFFVIQTKADAYSYHSETLDDTRIEVEASDEWQSVDIDLTVDNAVLVGFIIKTQGSVFIRNGYYSLEVDRDDLSEVDLALVTTTFRKEDFILPNIEMLKREILACEEEIADHFHVFVVDNGRTLDVQGLSDEGVTICPNDNVGGAGGFARGMIEAMEGDFPATHVLLMDDDVAVSPESIKRTFTLLQILNEQYRGAFISGAMLNYEIGDEFWEDLGYMTEGGFCRPVKHGSPGNLRMSQLHDVIQMELMSPNDSQEQTYAAWWYCCIPVAVIRDQGLPLPIFVRYDDVEYSLRCKPKFITMSGLCIWHLSFHSRYNAAVERYQTTRNAFVAQAISDMARRSDFLTELYHNMQLELKKYNYINAELALEGFEDFLKGPSYIMQPIAERRFMDANKNAEKLVSLEDLFEQAKSIGFDLANVDCTDIENDVPRSTKEALIDFLSFNGQRIFNTSGENEVAVIPSLGWSYPAGKIRGAEYLVAVDPYNRKGVIRKKDKTRFKEVWSRYKKDVRHYKKNKRSLHAEYAAVRKEITSVDYWKKYLGIG